MKECNILPLLFAFFLAFGSVNVYAISKQTKLDSLQETTEGWKAKDSLAQWLNDSKKISQLYREAGQIDSGLFILNNTLAGVWRNPITTSEKQKLAWVYVNRAYLYEQQYGFFLKAKQDYIKAYQLFEEIELNDYYVASFVWRPLANIYTRLGENELAIQLLKDFLQICIKQGNKPMQLSAANDLGRAYMNKGDYQQAIDLLEDVLSLEHEDNYNKGLLYSSLAEFYLYSKNYEAGKLAAISSIAFLIKAEVVTRNNPFVNSVCKRYLFGVYTQLGIIYSKTENFKKAEQSFKKALFFKEVFSEGKHRKKAILFLARAENSLTQNKASEAFGLFHKALLESITNFNMQDSLTYPESAQLFAEVLVGEALLGKAKAARLNYFFDGNKEWLKQSKKGFQLYFEWEKKLRSEYRFEPSKLLLAAEIHSNTEEALALLVEMQQVETGTSGGELAFQWIEQSKGILLSESEVDLFSRIPDLQNDSNLEEIQNLKKQYRLMDKKNTELPRNGNNDFDNQIEKRIISLENKLAEDYPYYHQFKTEANNSVSPQRLSNYLMQQQANLISYFVGDSVIYLVVVTEKQSQLLALNKAENWGLLNQLNQLVRNPQLSTSREYALIATKIYEWLVKPCAKAIQKRNLIILTDALLAELPFEALVVDNKTAATSYKTLNYLLKHKHISYAPSAKFLLKENKIKTEELSFLGLAPDFKNSFLLSNLNEALSEIKTGQKQLGGEIFTGTQLSKNEVLNRITKPTVLHWVSHAESKTSELNNSWIAISSQQDTIIKLYPPELLPLQLSTQLLILNACETAKGSYRAGEGNYSLARAFLYSGVQSVITNLWQANHAANAQIFEQFYKNLAEENSASALQNAKQHYLNNENTDDLGAHPYYWASPVLIGNNQTINVEQSSRSVYLYFLFFLFFIGVGYFFYRRSKN